MNGFLYVADDDTVTLSVEGNNAVGDRLGLESGGEKRKNEYWICKCNLQYQVRVGNNNDNDDIKK